MVRAEVMQGWFHGAYLFAFGAQFWYLVLVERFGAGSGNNLPAGVVYCFLAFTVVVYTKDRWRDRPETRAKYAAIE